MIISPALIGAAKRWGSSNLAGQQPQGSEPRVSADQVVDLLAGRTSPAAQPGARKLINQMAIGPWMVVRGLHASSDLTPHITIEIAGSRYHLRCDARGCIFDITTTVAGGRARPAGSKPWAGPGA